MFWLKLSVITEKKYAILLEFQITRNIRIPSKNETEGEAPFHPVMLRQTNPSDLGIFEII